MFFYTNVAVDGNDILFRGYKDGKKVLQKVKYSPSLFIEKETGEFFSLEKTPLDRMQFESIKAMKEFKMEMSDLSNVSLYGTTNVKTQFVNEYFGEDIEYDMDLFTIMSIDIETKTDVGRIDTINTPNEVSLITMKNFVTKEIITFGCWNFVFDREKIEAILAKQNITLDLDRLMNFK